MAEKKRLFQVLDEMNLHDINKATQWVTIHPDVLGAQLVQKGKGTEIRVGVPAERFTPNDLFGDGPKKKRVVLMIINGLEYDRRAAQDINADAHDNWTDPYDKLPENNQKVLFIVGNGNHLKLGTFLFVDQFERKNMFCDGAFHSIDNVPWWMPIPEQP